MLLNCGVGQDSWESLGLQGNHPKGDQSWVFIGRTDVEAETPTLWPPDAKTWLIWKDPDTGKDWGQEEKGRQRMRWLDGITDSMVWVWVDSRIWWWTGRPGMLQSMGSQWVGHDWRTELNWTDSPWSCKASDMSEKPFTHLLFTCLRTFHSHDTSHTFQHQHLRESQCPLH